MANTVDAATPAADASSPRSLQGRMGTLDVMFTVLSYNGPAVVFMGFIPVAIAYGVGLGTPALFILIGLLVLLIATGLMRMSNDLKRPGGFYAFITAGLGRLPGLAAGFAAIVTYFAALISVYALAGIALSDILTVLFNGPELDWWVGALIVFVIVSIIGYFNISLSARTLMVFLALELALILVYVVAVFAQGGAEGISLAPFSPDQLLAGSLAIGALFAVGVFGGFEATVIFRDEVRDPDRTIPRATYAVVATIAITYALASWAFITAYGPSVVMDVLAEDVVTVSGESLLTYVGEWAYIAAIILLFTSSLALALSAHNILSRYIFNLGADGILPRTLGESHAKHASPHRASVFVSIASVVTLVVLLIAQVPKAGLYGYIAGIYSYGMLILMTLVSLTICVYLVRKRGKSVGHGIAIGAAFVIMLLILVFASGNFDLLSGLGGLGGFILMAIIWLFILSGFITALVLRSRKPEVYRRIGRQ